MEFNSLVNGWPFAAYPELLRRIELAERYAQTHDISDRQKRVLNDMKEAARKAGEAGGQ